MSYITLQRIVFLDIYIKAWEINIVNPGAMNDICCRYRDREI
jgi:hypothetical protein